MKKTLIVVLISIMTSSVKAFDNDYSINPTNFNTENFLDLNKAEFPEWLNAPWYASDNGWRISSHSLTSDLTYLHTQVKLHQSLSDYAAMRLNYDQEIIYADKEVQPPELEFEVRPVPKYPATFSIIGAFQYDKSNSEQGFALTYGDRKKNFIRYSSMNIDKYHNQKTSDNSEYIIYPYTNILEGAYHWSNKLNARFKYTEFTPMEFLFDNQVTNFKHEGNQYDAFVKYKRNENNHFKIRMKGFEIDKSLTGTTDQAQTIKYDSVDIKWLARQQHAYKLGFGLRYDDFQNDIVSTITSSTVLDYPYSMNQIYSTVTHAYSDQGTWELGLYAGIAKEPTDALNNDADNKGIPETKLNYVWSYSSKNKKSVVFLHISFNLDNFSEDPGDGGGLTYQSTF